MLGQGLQWLLAGGAGIETALYAAADAGDGWGYQTIRSELRRARLTGRSPWDTFAALAERLGITAGTSKGQLFKARRVVRARLSPDTVEKT